MVSTAWTWLGLALSLLSSTTLAFTSEVPAPLRPLPLMTSNKICHAMAPNRSRRNVRLSSPRQLSTKLGASRNDVFTIDDDDYLVTDSVDLLDEDRPTLLETLNNPRDILALFLILPLAGSISICNLLGLYTDVYTDLEVLSIGLGVLSGFASFYQIATGYKIKDHSRRLLVEDSNVNAYAGVYALAVSWLALRASNACPDWLSSMDFILPWVCLSVFFLSAVIPAITLFDPGNFLDETPPLSETELLRARGLLGIGILASVFAPDCLAFGLGGSEWWDRVSALHPSQKVLESSTSLFALYANEASMIAHRCGKAGVAPFRLLVPAFAAVCFLLAILPCIAALYWLGNDVSFFSFYRA